MSSGQIHEVHGYDTEGDADFNAAWSDSQAPRQYSPSDQEHAEEEEDHIRSGIAEGIGQSSSDTQGRDDERQRQGPKSALAGR